MNILKIKLLLTIAILFFLSITCEAQMITETSSRVGIAQPSPKVMIHIGKNSGLSGTLSGVKTVLGHNRYYDAVQRRDERISKGNACQLMLNLDGELVFQTADEDDKDIKITWKNALLVDSKGRVSIGSSGRDLFKEDDNTTDISEENYKLFVEKGIITEKVKCAIDKSTDWADYVFEEDYEMMDINDLEGFVTENKHLPNVPSAEEMVENGLDVAKMDAKLLEKIEEAYLYIIDMNKEMKTMNEKVDALANENESLKSSLQSLSTSGN